MLAGIGDDIEELFESLAAAGVLENTTIIFSSDQGVHYGEHRWGSAYASRRLAGSA